MARSKEITGPFYCATICAIHRAVTTALHSGMSLLVVPCCDLTVLQQTMVEMALCQGVPRAYGGSSVRSLPSKPLLQSGTQLTMAVSPVQLVASVAQRLGIRVDDLSPGEKIQLITAAVGAWQTFQQRDHHRDASA